MAKAFRYEPQTVGKPSSLCFSWKTVSVGIDNNPLNAALRPDCELEDTRTGCFAGPTPVLETLARAMTIIGNRKAKRPQPHQSLYLLAEHPRPASMITRSTA